MACRMKTPNDQQSPVRQSVCESAYDVTFHDLLGDHLYRTETALKQDSLQSTRLQLPDQSKSFMPSLTCMNYRSQRLPERWKPYMLLR